MNSTATFVEKGTLWQRFISFINKIGFSPLGLALLLIVAVLPNFYPFSQEYVIRWLIMGAFLAAQSVAFDFTAG